MRLSYLTIVVIAVLGAAAQEPRVGLTTDSGTLSRKGTTVPFFISAAAATSPAGGIEWRVFPEGDRALLAARLAERAKRATPRAHDGGATAEGMCDTKVLTFDHAGRGQTWDDIRNEAQATYRGRVVATTPGFRSGAPVTLVTMEISTTYQTAPGFPSRGTIQFITSAADFTIAGERFCNGGSHGGLIPRRGDEVLLAARLAPVDAAGAFIPTSDVQVVFSRENELIASDLLPGGGALAGRTLDDLGRRKNGIDRPRK